MLFPVDFASKGSSQIGGNIATNAGGIKVLRYGMMRDWVLGLTVVTGRGDILHLNKGLIKNATGYDLRHLFIGSEGTLGIVVEAELRLTRPPVEPQVVVFGIPDIHKVVMVMNAFRQKMDLLAFEFFSDAALSHVMEQMNLPAPLSSRHPYYVVMEFEALDGKNTEIVFDLYQKLYQKKWISDDVFGQDTEEMKRLWGYREHISSCITPRTPYKNDISVKVSKIPDFLQKINQVVTRHYPDFEIVWFGHIADGNLHLNILKPEGMPTSDFERKCQSVNDQVFAIVAECGGSISAEHGVGLLKRPYLHYSRPPHEIEYLRLIKQSFDPHHIMNPGKVFSVTSDQ